MDVASFSSVGARLRMWVWPHFFSWCHGALFLGLQFYRSFSFTFRLDLLLSCHRNALLGMWVWYYSFLVWYYYTRFGRRVWFDFLLGRYHITRLCVWTWLCFFLNWYHTTLLWVWVWLCYLLLLCNAFLSTRVGKDVQFNLRLIGSWCGRSWNRKESCFLVLWITRQCTRLFAWSCEYCIQ